MSSNNEMVEIIKKFRDQAECYKTRELAESIHAELLRTNPELLDAWVRETVIGQIHEEINRQDRAARSRSFWDRRSDKMDRRSEAAETGIPDADDVIRLAWVVDAEHTKLELGLMRRTELRFVAENYRRSERQSQYAAVLFETVAAKVGEKQVREVYSSQQLVELGFGRSAND